MDKRRVAELAVIRRLSHLWGVAPYRIDVDVNHRTGQLCVQLDGTRPPRYFLDILENDIETTTTSAKSRMN